MNNFERFMRERQYLQNVTPATIHWYKNGLRWLPSETPTQEQLKDAVIRMRERGLKATGCNCLIRAINSYLHWCANPDIKCSPVCTHLRIPKLKEPDLVLPTFSGDQVARLVAWKPRGFYERRLHLLVLFLLDTGCRISEALNARVSDVDLDNLLVLLNGKGRKQRRVPFSFALRRAMVRFISEFQRRPDHLLLASGYDTELGRRNTLRDIKKLCRTLGFEPPPRTQHAFRHTFGANYVRRGGSVFHLQKCLGHSDLEMTKRYANMMVEDLQAVHEQVSLLSSR